MKIYKVSFRDGFQEHKGYEYFSSKKEALKAKRDFIGKKEDVDEETGYCEIEKINVNPTKGGIIEVLTIHGGHPNNG